MLILALLVASPVFCSQATALGERVQRTTTKNDAENKRAEHSACYAVQVGAYEDRAEVAGKLDKLAREFPHRMMLTQVSTSDKTLWRLRVLATSQAEAKRVSERLSTERGIQPWIIPIACADSASGRLDRARLARRIETPKRGSARLVEGTASFLTRKSQASVSVSEMEGPARVNDRMVWLMTIGTFLVTASVVFLVFTLYFRVAGRSNA